MLQYFFSDKKAEKETILSDYTLVQFVKTKVLGLEFDVHVVYFAKYVACSRQTEACALCQQCSSSVRLDLHHQFYPLKLEIENSTEKHPVVQVFSQ